MHRSVPCILLGDTSPRGGNTPRRPLNQEQAADWRGQCPKVNGPADSGCHRAEAPSVLTARRKRHLLPGSEQRAGTRDPCAHSRALGRLCARPLSLFNSASGPGGQGAAAWWRGDDPLRASHSDPSGTSPGDRRCTCCLRQCGNCHCHRRHRHGLPGCFPLPHREHRPWLMPRPATPCPCVQAHITSSFSSHLRKYAGPHPFLPSLHSRG